MIAVFKREFKAYLHSMYAFIYATVFLVFVGLFTTILNFYGDGSGGYSNFEYVLYEMQLVTIFLLPILAMRSMAEDNRNKTDRFLLTLPISPAKIILGKYFALISVFSLPLIISAIYPLILSIYSTGGINFGMTYASILAFWLLGCALLAICMFMSSLTENQLIAAVLGIAVLLVLYLIDSLAYLIPETPLGSFIAFAVIAVALALISYGMTKSPTAAVIVAAVLIIPLSILYIFFTEKFSGLFSDVISELGLFTRFVYFTYGIFDVATIVIYLSVTVLFVFLTVQSLDKKRWN